MIQTIKFRLHTPNSQEQQLKEIFTIYNRVKRKGYKLFFNKRDILFSKDSEVKKELDKEIHQRLMQESHNNPYVNSIRIDCKMKLAQQKTWLEKRKIYLTHQIAMILEKIEQIKEKNRKDRRLRGLYSRLSSVQHKLSTHVLASYVIALKGLKFKECLPARYKWLLAQVGDVIKPRLKPSSPYHNWAKLHDFFNYSRITSFKTSEVM